MSLKDLDLCDLLKRITNLLDNVTCIECCKYCTRPTTATCAHTLCHSCWRLRRNCPLCGFQVEKSALKLNLAYQDVTSNTIKLRKSFEELFKINLEELNMDIHTPHHIKERLPNSQDLFSVPVTNSQQFVQETVKSVSQVTAVAQIHTGNVQRKETEREIVPVKLNQDDWDKIEEMVETRTSKNQVNSMDIETINIINDEDYTTNNPRRSSRTKELKSSNTNIITHDNSSIKDCGKNNINSDTKSNKSVQNRKNVKKMKKQFSLLNQKNRNKLNVSIEMCKNRKHANKTLLHSSQQESYNIENNTPEIVANKGNQENEDINRVVTEDLRNSALDISNEVQSLVGVNDVIRNNINECGEHGTTSKVRFIKRGALQTKSINRNSTHMDTDNINKNNAGNAFTVDNDDIEITIKMLNIMYCIKKKGNDVQFKINSDRETQTSKQASWLVNKPNIHLQTNNNEATSNVQIDKSVSTKNTATADTASVQFEIAQSVEKQVPEHMDSAQFSNKPHLKTSQEVSKSHGNLESKCQPLSKSLDDIPEDIQFFNDVDIFEGESVKEGNVELLKSSKNTPSEIFTLTVKSKSKSQKTTNKRNRDAYDVGDNLNNKKVKFTQQTVESNNGAKKDELKINGDNDSEHISYDTIMSQVFANINADMEKLHETGSNNPINNTLHSNNKNTEIWKATSSKSIDPTEHPKDFSPVLKTSSNYDKTVIEDNENLSSQNNGMDIDELGTPIQDDDDKSIVEETPQKNVSFVRKQHINEVTTLNNNVTVDQHLFTKGNKSTNEPENVVDISDSSREISKNPITNLETPLTITTFVDRIKYKSTPVARKSLNFKCQNVANDFEENLCPSSVVAAKTTQEREFMSMAFEPSSNSQTHTSYAGKNRGRATKFCIAGSCLTTSEQKNLRALCLTRNWSYVETYTKDLSHLVVAVDEENKSQRSVKYIRALAGGKWIISYEWVEKCLQVKGFVDEEPFEALDTTGEPGPRRSRLAKQKLFQGITFHCMPPFTILNVETLKDILEDSGGRVVDEAGDVRVANTPAMLLAEPAHTQENRFIYLTVELSIVPVNYEWVINCLGSYTLIPICELLLCPPSLLPPATSKWPSELISTCYE